MLKQQPTPLPAEPMRLLARRAGVFGREHRLVLVTLGPEGVTVHPFDREVHSTAFVDHLIVENGPDGLPCYRLA